MDKDEIKTNKLLNDIQEEENLKKEEEAKERSFSIEDELDEEIGQILKKTIPDETKISELLLKNPEPEVNEELREERR